MRVLLQALPLPPYFSSSAKFPVDRVLCHFRRQSLEEHVAELGRSAGVQGFLNPRWRKRLGGIVLEAGLRQQAARLSSSGMAGAANGPPPLYRANVGVCLLNAKNEVWRVLCPPDCVWSSHEYLSWGCNFFCHLGACLFQVESGYGQECLNSKPCRPIMIIR